MYISKINQNQDQEQIREFLKSNAFAIVVSQTEGKLWGTHIPLFPEINAAGREVLTGHVSKANLQWKSFEDGCEVLAIFSGPHAYVSSSWYDHINVPTWNYIAVHVYGKTRLLNQEETLEALKKLTNKYEAASVHPVSVEAMPADFVESHLRGLVCFEIEITEIQAAYKLSQNRDDKNHKNIIQALEDRGDADSRAIAAAMAKNR